MPILLGSGGYRTPERIAKFRGRLRAHLGDMQRVLFIPYALADHDKYVQILNERGLNADYELVGIHTLPDPRQAVREAEAIYVGVSPTSGLARAPTSPARR
jgi:dipeptidase E